MSFKNLTLPSFPAQEETFSFTSEQEEIFYTFSELYASRSSNLVVDALAGTGKSSTVLALAEKNPEVNFLMVCFNKKNAEELTSRCMASGIYNLIAKTTHKIAYDWYVSSTGKRPVNFIDVAWIEERIAPRVEFDSGKVRSTSWNILNLVKAFCQEDFLTLEDFLKAFPDWHKLGAATILGTQLFLDECLNLNTDPKKPISLDGVIKLFQLCRVQLCDDKDTVLIIEEYQDINGNQAGILASQENFKIAIGDVNQNIYSWRGAGKFVEIVEQEEWFKLFLTTSFRVNPTDADFANTLLKLINSANPVFKGASKKKEIQTTAFLSRTNASAIVKAVELLEAKKEFALTLELKPLWEELWYLFNLNKGKTGGKKPPASLSWIKTKKDLNEAYENLSDIRRLVNLLNLLQGCPGGLYNMQKRLDQLAKDTEGKALPISIGTVHKAKGLEWDEVFLNEDILEALLPRQDEEAEEESFNKEEKLEELRLLYVAVTRAKVKTNLPDGLEDFIYSLI